MDLEFAKNTVKFIVQEAHKDADVVVEVNE